MPTAQFSQSLQGGGVAIQSSIVRQADNGNGYELSLPAAKPLTAWVKTDENTAAGNLPAGHGYANGTFDVYWDGGQRLDVPGTISTNALTLDGGTGDEFPASANTTVRVFRQISANVTIDGDNAAIVGFQLHYANRAAVAGGRVLLEDSTGDDIADLTLEANVPRVWDIEGGSGNPFTGDVIAEATASHDNVDSAATLKVIVLQDSTP